MMRALTAFALGAALLGPPAEAQVYPMCPPGPQGQVCRVWYGITTTNSSGAWSVSFPANTFTATPVVHPTALSADATLANSATASLTAQSSTGASGVVTIPATIVVGGSPIKAAGAGLTVDVVAVGY